jgi:hypothetical protein
LEDQRIPEASSCKYLRIISGSDLSCANKFNYTVTKAWKAKHFIMRVLRKGNNNTKSLDYTSPACPILEHGAAYWDPYRESQINTLDRVQKKAWIFANHTKESVWETLAHRRKITRNCTLFKAYNRERALKSIGDRLRGPCYLSRDDYEPNIRARKQRTDIGVYCFVYRKLNLWNQLPAEALAVFLCR